MGEKEKLRGKRGAESNGALEMEGKKRDCAEPREKESGVKERRKERARAIMQKYKGMERQKQRKLEKRLSFKT